MIYLALEEKKAELKPLRFTIEKCLNARCNRVRVFHVEVMTAFDVDVFHMRNSGKTVLIDCFKFRDVPGKPQMQLYRT